MADNAKYKRIGLEVAEFLRRTPATPSMILASLDAGKRVDEGLVIHV